MLSYRHAFHAGNQGDVLKHAVLCRVLNYLVGKDKPLLYLDTHAGAGQYVLRGKAALRTGEAEAGIGRLWRSSAPPPLLAPYLEQVRAMNPNGRLLRYPGSPLLAARILRPGDRGVVHESHPTDYLNLAAQLAEDRRFRVSREDGWTGPRAQLPPRERRALILMDPSYEGDTDYRAAPKALEEALERFPSGVYLLWYPLLDDAPVERMLRRILERAPPKTLRLELRLAPGGPGQGMAGSGLLLINPPWTLEAELNEALPWLAQRLGGAQGGWRVGHA